MVRSRQLRQLGTPLGKHPPPLHGLPTFDGCCCCRGLEAAGEEGAVGALAASSIRDAQQLAAQHAGQLSALRAVQAASRISKRVLLARG